MVETLKFTEKQKRVIKHAKSPDHAFLSVGAIRSGKTYASRYAFFFYTQALTQHYLHIIAGRNLRVMENELVTELQEMARQFGVDSSYRRIDSTLTIGKQTYLIVAGHDANSEKRIQGLTVHSAIVDEATLVPKSFFEQLVGRQTFDESKLWVTCNPSSPYHWLKKEWIDKDRIKDVEYFSFEDNPTLGQATIERNRSMFSGVFHKRMIEGQWAVADGVIYPYWQHLDYPYNPEDVKSIDIGVDYGIQSVSAFVKVVTLKNGKQIVKQNYHYDGSKKVKNDIDLAEDLVEFIGKDNVRFVYVDPSASSFIETLKRVKGRRWSVRKADNDVLPGIRVTLNRFEHHNLFISKDPSNQPLIEEISEYSWDDDKEDTPIKMNDHHCDALRYVIYNTNKRFYPSKNITLAGTDL